MHRILYIFKIVFLVQVWMIKYLWAKDHQTGPNHCSIWCWSIAHLLSIHLFICDICTFCIKLSAILLSDNILLTITIYLFFQNALLLLKEIYFIQIIKYCWYLQCLQKVYARNTRTRTYSILHDIFLLCMRYILMYLTMNYLFQVIYLTQSS